MQSAEARPTFLYNKNNKLEIDNKYRKCNHCSKIENFDDGLFLFFILKTQIKDFLREKKRELCQIRRII